MQTIHRQAGKREAYIGVGILVLLVLIGLRVWWQQDQFNPAVSALRSEAHVVKELPAAQADLIDTLPAGLAVMTPAERFDSGSLYEKINGQAELYLSAGFVGLTSQRLAATDMPDLWLEVFVYDMGSGINAFAVYSSQRREDAKPVAGLSQAYRTDNALFAAHGDLYIEIIAAVSSGQADQMMHALVVSLMEARPASGAPAIGLEWFPPTGRNPDSVTVIPANAFGVEKLDRVVTVTYILNGSEVTAFVSQRPTVQAAQTLAEAFQTFLLTYGGRTLDPEPSLPTAHIIEIMDTFDIVFTVGPFIAGVHEAMDRSTAIDLALRLKQTLKGIARGE